MVLQSVGIWDCLANLYAHECICDYSWFAGTVSFMVLMARSKVREKKQNDTTIMPENSNEPKDIHKLEIEKSLRVISGIIKFLTTNA